MANGRLQYHLEGAWQELRADVEAARRLGEEARSRLVLNGIEDRLPSGLLEALRQLRQRYEEAVTACEKTLAAHFAGVAALEPEAAGDEPEQQTGEEAP